MLSSKRPSRQKNKSRLGLEYNQSILMDIHAKLSQTTSQSLQEHELDLAVMVNNKRITGIIVKEMTNILNQSHLTQFYKKKCLKQYQNIIWEQFFTAIQKK
jgi:hypothetical protein